MWVSTVRVRRVKAGAPRQVHRAILRRTHPDCSGHRPSLSKARYPDADGCRPQDAAVDQAGRPGGCPVLPLGRPGDRGGASIAARNGFCARADTPPGENSPRGAGHRGLALHLARGGVEVVAGAAASPRKAAAILGIPARPVAAAWTPPGLAGSLRCRARCSSRRSSGTSSASS